jgi:hypothetical protein
MLHNIMNVILYNVIYHRRKQLSRKLKTELESKLKAAKQIKEAIEEVKNGGSREGDLLSSTRSSAYEEILTSTMTREQKLCALAVVVLENINENLTFDDDINLKNEV